MNVSAKNAAAGEWNEIVFTAAFSAGRLADSTFTAENSAFTVTCIDSMASKYATIDASTCIFGTEAENQTYTFRLKPNSTTPYLSINIPADGILRIAARTAKNADDTRTIVVEQNGVELLTQIIKEADATMINDTVPYYPYYSVRVQPGTVKISVPVGPVNFYSLAFKEEADPDAGTHFFIAGSMTDWQQGMVEMEKHGTAYTATLPLEAKTQYQFKVVKVLGTDTTWYGINVAEGASWEPMTADNCTGWWLSEGQNIGLKTTRKGEYTFRYVENENNEISVSYPSEWDEIYFTAVTEAGINAFNDSIFTVKNSDFYMYVNDVKNLVSVKEAGKVYKYGDTTSYTAYAYHINSGSKFTELVFNIPADGVLRIAAHKTDVRNYYVVQNGETIATFEVNNTAISEDGYWPYAYVNVSEGTVFICTTEGSVNFFAIAFKEEAETPSTGIDSIEAAKFGSSSKFLRNGRIFIRRGDKIYTLQGQETK